MAATLPAIHSPGTQSPAVQQHRVASPPQQSHGTPASGKRRYFLEGAVKRSQGKKERELEQRRMMLRAQQPDLSKRQTNQYRNSYSHNLFLDMLQEGFHKSFAELFALIKQQNKEREKAGPESVMWNQVQLENEPDKLEILKEYLTRAETATRRGNFEEVYKCNHKLARYFQQRGDKWLADHFFENCLNTSGNVKEGAKLAAEGHCNVGLALEESGDNFAAAENFELFHKLTADNPDWTLESGETMHYEACRHLTRIYTTIGNSFEENDDSEQYLAYMQKAYDKAKESGDRKFEGEAAYILGQAYEKNGDPETSLLYLNQYLDSCRTAGNEEGVGKACEAIARAYESQGKVEESIKYLEMFVEVAEKSKDDKAISRACSNLGTMFNSLGRYSQAVDYFNKAYNIARAMNDTETISSSRVLFGVAAAHKMLNNTAAHVDLGNRACIERLIEWKDNRGDEFDKPVPEPGEEREETISEDEEKEDISDDKPADNDEQNEEQHEATITEETADDLEGETGIETKEDTKASLLTTEATATTITTTTTESEDL